MVPEDREYVLACIDGSILRSPVLELGVGYEGPNNREVVEKAGLLYVGTDMVPGRYVDFIVDFEDSAEKVRSAVEGRLFGSALVLNVLEHAFDPIRVLDNVLSVLEPGGTCVVITPAVWPLHGFPRDYWRINPDFYEDYCRKRGCLLLREYFRFVGRDVISGRDGEANAYVLPRPSDSRLKTLISRIVHKLFNTFGRGMLFPSHVAVGAVIRKQSGE